MLKITPEVLYIIKQDTHTSNLICKLNLANFQRVFILIVKAPAKSICKCRLRKSRLMHPYANSIGKFKYIGKYILLNQGPELQYLLRIKEDLS